ncbi:hypothetical protein JAB2_24200 [Janthinobacterium sp. HH100]|nr:hypothetical protein JAB2_24200 [Janthinobacterium sp. HH100]
MLVAARIEVGDEQGQRLAVGIQNVVDAHVRVVYRQVLPFLEADAVQLIGGKEDAIVQHAVEFQVRFQLVFIEIETLLAQLVRVDGPVGRCHLETALFRIDHLLQVGRFAARIRDGRFRQFRQQGIDGRRGLGRLVFQRVRGVVGVTEQGRPFGAQFGQFQHDGAVVELAALAAAVQRRVHQALTRLAIRQYGQRRLAAGVDEGDDELARQAPVLGGRGSRVDIAVRHAGQLGTGVDDDALGIRFLQDVLREGRFQARLLGVIGFQFFLVRIGQLGAGAHEIRVIALEQAQGFGIEAQLVALGVQGVDAGKQFRVQRDGVAMRGQFRRHVHFHRFQHGIGIGRGHVAEDALHAVQQLSRALEGHDGVFKRGRLAVVGNRIDFGQLAFHAFGKRRRVVTILDQAELRHLERQRAHFEQGVLGADGGGRCSGGGHGGWGGVGQHDAGGDDEQLWTDHDIFQEAREEPRSRRGPVADHSSLSHRRHPTWAILWCIPPNARFTTVYRQNPQIKMAAHCRAAIDVQHRRGRC